NLPVQLPAAGGRPALALVLSADTRAMTAVRLGDGKEVWKYRLSEACLGRPVVIDRRAYIPTYDGQVHEIELAEGNLLRRYNLGQRLSLGGARLEGTKMIYFPADDSCVYMLDVGQRVCAGILYTDHASGSLRGEPIIIPHDDPRNLPPDAVPEGFLVLTQ